MNLPIKSVGLLSMPMINVGRLWHNQATRMAERFGMFDFDKLDTSAPVFKSVADCYDFHEAE